MAMAIAIKTYPAWWACVYVPGLAQASKLEGPAIQSQHTADKARWLAVVTGMSVAYKILALSL